MRVERAVLDGYLLRDRVSYGDGFTRSISFDVDTRDFDKWRIDCGGGCEVRR